MTFKVKRSKIKGTFLKVLFSKKKTNIIFVAIRLISFFDWIQCSCSFLSSLNALPSLWNAARGSVTSPNRPYTLSHRHLTTPRHPFTLTHYILTSPHHNITHFWAYHCHVTPCCSALAPHRCSITPLCCILTPPPPVFLSCLMPFDAL